MRLRSAGNKGVSFNILYLVFLVVILTGILFGMPFPGDIFSFREDGPVASDTVIAQRKPGNDSVYSSILAKARAFYTSKKYDEALAEYQKALKIKPGDQQVSEAIENLKSVIGQQKKVVDDYRKTVASGDNYFREKDYLNAKNAYQYALDLVPGDQYAKEKLNQTMELIRSQKA